MKKIILLAALVGLTAKTVAAETNAPFTGRIEATVTRGGEVQHLILTAGTNYLRLERAETDRPYARNLIDRTTGEVTLLFPHNRSYTRLPHGNGSSNKGVPPAGPGGMPPPNFPASVPGPASEPPTHIGPTNLPGDPAMPAPPAMPRMPAMPPMGSGGMPMMPPMAMMQEPMELKALEGVTNVLGFTCRRYEIKQRAEIMEIWAVQTNLPFAPWQQNQRPRFGPRLLEEQWADLVAEKKLFPVLAVLKFENGPERLRYEVQTVTPQKPDTQPAELFTPPAEYQFIEPLPF